MLELNLNVFELFGLRVVPVQQFFKHTLKIKFLNRIGDLLNINTDVLLSTFLTSNRNRSKI